MPDFSTVVGVPGRVVRSRTETVETLEHGHLPDPEGQAIDELSRRVEQLEELVRDLSAQRAGAIR